MSLRLGSARTWRIALAVLALLSYAAAIPLTVLSHQAADGVIAAVIGVPCAAVGWVVTRRQRGTRSAGSSLAARTIRVDSTGGLAAVDHSNGWFNAVQGPLIVLITGLSLVFVARQVLSWRRSVGDRRQQLKWLASGAAVTIVCLALAATLSTSGTPRTFLGVIGSLAWFGVAALPVSISVWLQH